MLFVGGYRLERTGDPLDQSDAGARRPSSLLTPSSSHAPQVPPGPRCREDARHSSPVIEHQRSQSDLPSTNSSRPRCVSLSRSAANRSAHPEQKRRRSFIEAITQGELSAAVAARENSQPRAPPSYQPPPPARHTPSRSEPVRSRDPPGRNPTWHRRYASAELDSRQKTPGEGRRSGSQESGSSAPSSLREAAPAVRSALEAFSRARAPRQRHSVAVTGQSSGTLRAFSVILQGDSAGRRNAGSPRYCSAGPLCPSQTPGLRGCALLPRTEPAGSATPTTSATSSPVSAEAEDVMEGASAASAGPSSRSQPDLPSTLSSPVQVSISLPQRSGPRPPQNLVLSKERETEAGQDETVQMMSLMDSPTISPFGSPTSSTDLSSPMASSPESGTSCSTSPVSSDLSSLQLSHAHSSQDVSSPAHSPSSPPPPTRRRLHSLARSLDALSASPLEPPEVPPLHALSASDAALDQVMVAMEPSDPPPRERGGMWLRPFWPLSDTDTSADEEDHPFPRRRRLDLLTVADFPSLPPPPPHIVESNAPQGEVPPGTENDWLIAYYLQQEENRRGGANPPPLPPERPRADTPTPSLPEGGQGALAPPPPNADQEEILQNLLLDMQGIMSMFQNVEGQPPIFPVQDAPYYKVPPLPSNDLRRLGHHKFGTEKNEKTESKGEKEECSICYSPFLKSERVRSLPCRHIYHMKCIDLWFKESGTCPFCRLDVRKALRKNRRRQKTRATSRNNNGGGIEVTRTSVASQTTRPVRNNHCTIL